MTRRGLFRTTAYWFMFVVASSQLCCHRNDPTPPVTPQGQTAMVHEPPADIDLVDVTESAGVNFTYSSGHDAGHHTLLQWVGGGVAMFDFDGDTLLDLLFAGGGEFAGEQIVGKSPRLFRQTERWKFTDVGQHSVGQIPPAYTHGCHIADYDNDGFPDALLTGYYGVQLLHNLGDGTFAEVHAQSGMEDDAWSTSAAWGDLNGDGNLDLYVCHYLNWSFANHPTCRASRNGLVDACAPKRFEPLDDIVYYANGDGTVRVATQEAGLVPGGKGLGVVMADVDLDLDLDVYVANDTTENFLYLNDGGGTLLETGVLNGVSGDDLGDVNGSMGVDVGDYNADGLPDIWVANYVEEPFALYKNLGSSVFQHVSKSTGLNSLGGIFVGFGTGFIDVDGDGDQDLVVSNGHVLQYPPSAPVRQVPLLLRNDAGRFVRVQVPDDQSYFSTAHLGRGLAWGDMDDDGDLDFAVSHLLEPAKLLRNDTSSDHRWLRVRLVGRQSNRDAIGAALTLQTTDGSQLRMIKGGGSYLSHPDSRPSWMLPPGVRAEELTVAWPNGEISTITEIPMNQTCTLIEPILANSPAK